MRRGFSSCFSPNGCSLWPNSVLAHLLPPRTDNSVQNNKDHATATTTPQPEPRHGDHGVRKNARRRVGGGTAVLSTTRNKRKLVFCDEGGANGNYFVHQQSSQPILPQAAQQALARDSISTKTSTITTRTLATTAQTSLRRQKSTIGRRKSAMAVLPSPSGGSAGTTASSGNLTSTSSFPRLKQITHSVSEEEFHDFGLFPDDYDGHYAFGRELGENMRSQIQAFVYAEPWYLEAWNFLQTSEEAREYSRYLRNFNEAKYPLIFAELRGLANGAEVDFERVWVTMCQQELLGMQYTADIGRPRGCSDLVTDNTICHNEDGSVDLLRQGKFVQFGFYKVNAPGDGSYSNFSAPLHPLKPPIQATGFCYPGALPGWGPCWNTAGVAYSINFLFPQSPCLVYHDVDAACQNLVDPFQSCVAIASRDFAFSESVWDPIEKTNDNKHDGLAFGQNLNIGSVREQTVLSTEMGPGNYHNIVEVKRTGAGSSTPTVADPPVVPYLFHGNRYNRDCKRPENKNQGNGGTNAKSVASGASFFNPASTNPGPCKRTKQFTEKYARGPPDGNDQTVLASSQQQPSYTVEEVLDVMSDMEKPFPIYRTRPDGIVTLFTVLFDFDFEREKERTKSGSTGAAAAVSSSPPLSTNKKLPKLNVTCWRHPGANTATGLKDTPPVVLAKLL
ncbi:unnamed protein product [Amoebophrya sp. A120]|nr:unnamed protein product [Amoebophrya sp. A120]|eukprot:GSA120T00025090001.1